MMHAIPGTIMPRRIVDDCVASKHMRSHDIIPLVPFDGCLLVFEHSTITITKMKVRMSAGTLVLVLVLDIEVLGHFVEVCTCTDTLHL